MSEEKPDALAMLDELEPLVSERHDTALQDIRAALLAERAEHARAANHAASLRAACQELVTDRWLLVTTNERETLLVVLRSDLAEILYSESARAAKVSSPEAWTWTDRKVAEFCELMKWAFKEDMIEHIERFKADYSPAFWEPPKPLEQRQCLTCRERFEGAVDGSTPCPHCNAVWGHCTKCGASWDRNTHTHMTGVDDSGNVECETILTSTIINRSL